MLPSPEPLLTRTGVALLRAFVPGEPSADPSAREFRSVLVVRQHNQLGDMLCVVPLLRALRRSHPGARIALLASPVNAGVMQGNSCLDEVILYDKREYLGRAGMRPGAAIGFLRRLRERKFDLVLTPSTVSMSATSDMLAMATGAGIRIGPGSLDGRPNPSRGAYTHPVNLDWRHSPHRHQTLRNLDVATALGLPEVPLHSEITLTEDEVAGAKSFLLKVSLPPASFVVYHPGAGKPPNRWPAGRFAELANAIAGETGMGTVVTSGSFDRVPVGEMTAALRVRYSVLENRPIREVAAVLRQARLVVSNDTGIMHVAGAVGTPVLSLFGPTDPHQWAPLNRGSRDIGEGGSAIDRIETREVLEAARSMLLEPYPADPLAGNEFGG